MEEKAREKGEERLEKKEERAEERLEREASRVEDEALRRKAKLDVEEEMIRAKDAKVTVDLSTEQAKDSPYNKTGLAIWKLVFAAIIIGLFAWLAVWAFHQPLSASSNPRLSFSDMNYLDETSESELMKGEEAIAFDEGIGWRVVSSGTSYPIRLRAEVMGDTLRAILFDGEAFVTYPEAIPDRWVDSFMRNLSDSSGISGLSWNLGGDGMVRINFPYSYTPSEAIEMADDALRYLVSYLNAYTMNVS